MIHLHLFAFGTGLSILIMVLIMGVNLSIDPYNTPTQIVFLIEVALFIIYLGIVSNTIRKQDLLLTETLESYEKLVGDLDGKRKK